MILSQWMNLDNIATCRAQIRRNSYVYFKSNIAYLPFNGVKLVWRKAIFIDVANNIIHLFQHFSAKRGEVSEFSNRRGASITRIWGKSWTAGKDKSRLLAQDYVGLRSDCLAMRGLKSKIYISGNSPPPTSVMVVVEIRERVGKRRVKKREEKALWMMGDARGM